ncbi:MAG: hypothetical protein WBQ37_10235 [Candidatus Competibacter sp.]
MTRRHHRPYRSIFGDFTLARVVYGTREGQRIEAAPLDARLGLPKNQCSYLLQDWDQALAVENPYGQVNTVLARILGLKQSVARLEAMTWPLAGATEKQIVVLSADGKGVPIRKPADARPSPSTITRGDPNLTVRRRWRSWAKPIRSSRIPERLRRWSSRCFAI